MPPLSGPVRLLVHHGPLVYWNDALRCRWSISQSTMQPDRVVVDAPLLDQVIGFAPAVEEFAVEQLFSVLRVEALAIPVLPG